MFNLVPNTGPSNTTKKELYLEHLFLELLCYIFRFQFRKVLRSTIWKKETTAPVFSCEFCEKLEILITFFVALQNGAKKIGYRSFFRDRLYTSFPLLSEPWWTN